MPLVELMTLHLDVVPLSNCFLGAIIDVEEAFLGRSWVFRREILRVGTHISMKAPICGDFPSRAIGRSTPQASREVGSVNKSNAQSRKRRFLRENPNRKKKPGGRGEDSTIILKFTGITKNLLVCL